MKVEVTVFRTLDEVEAIRDIWTALQAGTEGASLSADIDVFREVAAAKEDLEPYVMQIDGVSARPIVIVAYRRPVEFRPQIGYFRVNLFRKPRTCIEIVRGGCLGDITEDNASSVVSALLGVLADREADWVYFTGTPEHSPLYACALEDTSWISRDHAPDRAIHFTMSVDCSIDEFYSSQSSKTRWRLRRIGKKLHEAFHGEVRVAVYRDPSDVVRFCEDAEQVAQTTYQRGLEAGFQDGPAARRRLALLAEKGWMRCFVLYLQGKPVAYIEGSVYQGTFLLETLGYLPELHKHNVGSYLHLQALEDLCSDPSAKTFDFGHGSDTYKQRFGDQSFQEASIVVFAPTLPGACINATRVGFGYVNDGGRRLLQKMGMYETFRKRWRQALSSVNET